MLDNFFVNILSMNPKNPLFFCYEIWEPKIDFRLYSFKENNKSKIFEAKKLALWSSRFPLSPDIL